MELDDIKKLMELMEEKGVIELEIKNASGEIRLVRENHRIPVQAAPVLAVSPPPITAALSTQTVIAPPLSPSEETQTSTAQPRGTAIPSPMVGTFYRSPNPDAKPYVDIGSVVEIGEVDCIVEAMKMMNEIQSEIRGRVIKIMVENGKPVEYGQPLFLLEPL